MTGTNAVTDIAAPEESVADKDAHVVPEAAKTTENDDRHSASSLAELLKGLEKSEAGLNEAKVLRQWICSTMDEGINESLTMRDSSGQTLLHVAARNRLVEAAQRLVKTGALAGLNARSYSRGFTPLLEACWVEHYGIVSLLLANGADTNIFDYHGRSALYLAARYRCSDITRLLLENGKWDLDLKDELSGMTPLHAAACGCDRETVRYLRKKGAKLSLRDNEGKTPLMTAVYWEEEDATTELLIRQGDEDIQLETRDSEGRTPLMRAAEDGFWAGFRLLVEAGATWGKAQSETTDPSDTGPASGMSKKDAALHLAVSRNQSDIVKILLKQGANANARGQNGRRPLHLASLQGSIPILELLYETQDFNDLSTADDDGMTPLHLACIADDDDDDGRHNEVVRRILKHNTRPHTEMMTREMKMAVELAFDHGHDERGEQILDVFVEAGSGVSDTLMWAAGKTERHKIAAYLLKGQLEVHLDSSTAKSSENWTPIEWAAYAKEPQALWLLIASSPQSKETKKALKLAEAMIEDHKNRLWKPVAESEKQKRGQMGDAKKRGKSDQVILEMQDIIQDPPTGLICTVSPTYSLPMAESKFSASLGAYNATIVRFYQKGGQSGSTSRVRTVGNTIYKQGPEKIMHEVLEKFGELSSGLEKRIAKSIQHPFFMDPEPKFTWIHLPATNMVWMDHLLQRIMRDENQHGSQFNQAKSFFRDSWIEVPDNTSVSRMMRPQYVARDTISHDLDYSGIQAKDADKISPEGRTDMEGDDANGNESADRTQKKSQEEDATKVSTVTAAAIYMPYLSYSFQCAEDMDEHEKELRHGNHSRRKELLYAKKLVKAREDYQALLNEYDGRIIHGSSTLDESYHHFGKDSESTTDRDKRNMSQVATGTWRKEQQPKAEGSGPYWLLVRVNQLWVWTINNKWVISACSHPIDDGKDELLKGILDRLQKQREAGGSGSQPGSTAEMSQLIVDYCVDSYERKPQAHEDERPQDCSLENFSSIRQTFSKAINSIARDETNLFERFRELTENLRESSYGDARDHSKAVKIMNEELADAIIQAEKLSCRVKDILDELSILEATVQYQQDVQRAMKKHNAQKATRKQGFQKLLGKENVLETELTATYTITDIRGLRSVAERVHAAVNTTLSLQQSEIANLQAKLSFEHAELATQQGRVLMVFTVVTILFLPLSFLTSLFALDVASFQQAPPWALGVIFSVSTAFFIPMVIVAFTWKRSKKFMLDKIHKIRRSPASQSPGNASETLQPSIRDLAEASNQNQANEAKSGPELEHSEASRRAEPQTTASSTHSSRARKRSDRSTPGDEEMALGFK